MDPELRAYLKSETTQLLDSIYDGVYIVDRNRKIVLWNSASEKITGHSRDHVLGHCCRDNLLNHIDGNGTLLCEGRCPLLQALDTGESTEAKVWPLHSDGHRIPVEVHVGPIFGSHGTPVGAIEVFRDISAEENYRRIEERFHRAIRHYVSTVAYESAQATSAGNRELPIVRELTVLFVDIVGFTPLTEHLGPEKTVQILNGFFGATSRGVRMHLGDIDKFIGDCALALFVDADDAIRAADEFLRVGLPALNESLVAQGLPELTVRIGVNSGSVVQGPIGAGDRRDWTVIGDVVNTASRVQSVATPGSYLITEATWARLNHPKDFALDQEILLKGKSLTVRLFRCKR